MAPRQRGTAGASASQKTLAVSAPAAARSRANVGGGTKILPDSSGVVAYAREKAAQARENALPDSLPAQPAGALFWLAWIILGVAAGSGVALLSGGAPRRT